MGPETAVEAQNAGQLFMIALAVYFVALVVFLVILNQKVTDQVKRVTYYFLFIMVTLVLLLVQANLALPNIAGLIDAWHSADNKEDLKLGEVVNYLQFHNLVLLQTIHILRQLIVTLAIWAILSGIPLFIMILRSGNPDAPEADAA